MSGERSVVIFEDSPNMTELLRYFFEKQGFRTRSYADGLDAVGRVRAESPALIVVDLMMPQRNGLQACADIRGAGIKTPIVVLTALEDQDVRARALAVGADVCLVKPFVADEFQAAVAPLLDRPKE